VSKRLKKLFLALQGGGAFGRVQRSKAGIQPRSFYCVEVDWSEFQETFGEGKVIRIRKEDNSGFHLIYQGEVLPQRFRNTAVICTKSPLGTWMKDGRAISKEK
jgi:hypothetical protein